MIVAIVLYNINTHLFHRNIWTHNWPAPNVTGFIAQLVEHRTGNREVTGSNPVEVLNFFQDTGFRSVIRLMANNGFDFVKSFELVVVAVLKGTFRFEDVDDYEDEIWLNPLNLKGDKHLISAWNITAL